MVSHRLISGSASHTLRVLGLATAYSLALTIGTALLIAALGAYDDGRVTGADGQKVTAAELVMEQAAQRAVALPDGVVLASRHLSNDKRGL